MQKAIATTAILSLLPLAPVYGHPSCELHVSDCKMVFNGYGDSRFNELATQVSKGIDSFQEKAGMNLGPKNHRLLCHSWTLDDSIPKEVLEEVERLRPGKRAEVIQAWKEFAGDLNQLAVKSTGLPKAQAKALVSMMYDLHLLGDYEPDNSELRHVLKPKEVVKNYIKNAEILFKNKPEFAKEVRETLLRVLKENPGLDEQKLAQNLMDKMMQLRLGDKLDAAWGRHLCWGYTEKRATAVDGKLKTRLSSRAATGAPLAKAETAAAKAPHIAKAQPPAKPMGTMPMHTASAKPAAGTLTRTAVARGLSGAEGVVLFDGGIASYQYLHGDIGYGDFEDKLAEACIKGAAVGIVLAVNPIGMPLIVGTAAYVAADLTIEACRSGHTCPEDIRAFGIQPAPTVFDSPQNCILTPKRPSVFDMHGNHPGGI